MSERKLKVVVVDMQPITPAVGGGRQRLLGLYHAMGPDISATYVGTYDWPGEAYRDVQLTEGLREICVPLEQPHFEAASRLSEQLDGATVIDLAFPEQVRHSPAFLEAVRTQVQGADVVVFTHPWCFPPLADALEAGQLVIYDAHNVETMLKLEALAGRDGSERLLTLVAETERDVVERSDLVLACSSEDAGLFVRLFDTDPMKLRIVPNGAFTERFEGASSADRNRNRAELGLRPDRPVAVFMGSMYGPNVDAAACIYDELARAMPGVDFLVVGGVGQALLDRPARPNVIITGVVDDARRDALLLAADVAINPMAAGSGTNIKMFDYMAAGLPVLSTAVGARGIGTADAAPPGVFVVDQAEFATHLPELLSRTKAEPELRAMVLAAVRERFSWERLSAHLGKLVVDAHRRHGSRASTKVGMLTTWNVKCGIGEHSAYLADAMSAAGAEVLILANEPDGHQLLGFERDLHRAVSRAWTWDNRRYADSRVDQDALRRLLRLASLDVLLLQHHTGFVPSFDVEAIVAAATEQGVQVVVEFHDGRNVAAELKQRLCELGATLVFHHADEAGGLDGACDEKIHIIPLPVRLTHPGNRLLPDAPGKGGPLVTGFGFLRPYKGVMLAIRVVAALRKEFPGVHYAGWHASYGEESDRHFAECMEEAVRLGVADAVEIDTRFHAVEDVVAELQRADVILLPYEPSSEGASAAVNVALAAERPVIVSPSDIFRPVSGVARMVDSHELRQYVQAASDILRNPGLASDMSSRAREWAATNSYQNAATRILSLTAT